MRYMAVRVWPAARRDGVGRLAEPGSALPVPLVSPSGALIGPRGGVRAGQRRVGADRWILLKPSWQ